MVGPVNHSSFGVKGPRLAERNLWREARWNLGFAHLLSEMRLLRFLMTGLELYFTIDRDSCPPSLSSRQRIKSHGIRKVAIINA